MIFPRSAITAATPFVAYLVSTFHQDVGESPSMNGVLHYLSKGNDPYNFIPLNNGKPVLKSTFGHKAARDPYLVQTTEKDRAWTLATDQDINTDGLYMGAFHGSQSIVVWSTTNLGKWDEPSWGLK